MTKVKIYSCFIISFLLFSSCGTDYGNKLESEELDVFYTEIDNEPHARNIALYWKNHNMLGSKKQYLQLDEEDDILILKLIATDKFNPASFPFEERLLLKRLQDSLQLIVAPKRLEIVIAEKNFEPIYNIN